MYDRVYIIAATKESFIRESKRNKINSPNRRVWVNSLGKVLGLYNLRYLEAEDASDLENYDKIKECLISNNSVQYKPYEY